MSEHRRLRFSDILGIERSDLPFACDIWLDDIYRAPWATREVMKLSAYFVRYMSKPDANALGIREVESQIQMPPEELRKTLVLMRNFNAVEGFLIERNDIRVGLKLSHTQRLRVLEARSRFAVLLAEPITRNWPWTTAEERWVPGEAAAPVQPAAVAVPPRLGARCCCCCHAAPTLRTAGCSQPGSVATCSRGATSCEPARRAGRYRGISRGLIEASRQKNRRRIYPSPVNAVEP